MDAFTRRAVAYIVSKIKIVHQRSAIYDHEELKQFSFNGIVRPEHVSVYDFIRKCHVGGQRMDNLFSLYDFGNGRHLTLSIDNAHFHGFDHIANKEFSGNVSGDSVTIHDDEFSKDFFYSV